MKRLAIALAASASLLSISAASDDGLIARWPAAGETDVEPFDGGQFIALPNAANAGEGPFSVSVWISPTDLATGDANYGRGIARSTREEKVGDWLLSVHRDGRVRFCNWRIPGDDREGSHVSKEPLIKDEDWHLVTATFDGTTTRLFVDGALAACNRGSTATGWGTGHEVGRSYTDPRYYWSGEIADFRVTSKALSNDEIAAFVKARPSSTPAALAEAPPTGDAAVSSLLDREVLAKMAERQILPAPPAYDGEFLRRVMLDLAGRIPTTAETEAFLADAAPDKRSRLIDTLLAGREMPLYWSQVMSTWLLPAAARRDSNFVAYLRQNLRKNKPWDQAVREMLLARESAAGDQYAKMFLTSRRAGLGDNSLARDVGQALLGTNFRCAQCHDHPHVAAWTHERFLGLAAFFARSFEHNYTLAGQQQVAIGEKPDGELEHKAKDGSKRPIPPTFLSGVAPAEPPPPMPAEGEKPVAPAKDAPPPVPAYSRREALANAALDPASPFVKRALVNRVWQKLMGRGLVEPVDMLHDGNPPSHPALLDLLADDFAGHGYDVRRLIAVIMKSEAYARTSEWPAGNLPDERLYAVAVPRPLDADQLALSLPIALGQYDQPAAGQKRRAPNRPAAPWTEVLSEFDVPTADFEPTAKQALFLLNSPAVEKRLTSDSKLPAELSAMANDTELAGRAYLGILARPPKPEEQQQIAAYLARRGPDSREGACRELVWALVTSAEFRFNH